MVAKFVGESSLTRRGFGAGADRAVSEFGFQKLGGEGVGGVAEDAALGIHRDRVASGEGGVRIQGLENGGMVGEDLAVVAKAGLRGAVHQVLIGAKLAEVGFDFSGGIVSGEDSGLALEGEAVGLEGAVGSGDQVVGEAVEGLAVLAEAAGRFEKKRSSMKGLELVFQKIEARVDMAAQAGGEVGELFQNLGGVGREDFGGGAGRWGAEVGDEVRDGEIDLVSHGAHHGDR
jgi:hypothetical protein